MSDTDPLEPWERTLYQAGYRAALVEASRVVVSRARAHVSAPDTFDPLMDAVRDITRLGDVEGPQPDDTVH